MEQTQVVKINTALSNKPYFVKVGSDMSVNTVMTEAISSLKNTGRPLEATQLEQLYDTHQLFNGGGEIEKGSILSELTSSTKIVGDQSIQLTEIDLIASHAGGC